MFKDFIVEKINKEISVLERLRYQNAAPVEEFRATPEPSDFSYPGFISPGKNSSPLRTGDFWNGRDTYLWLHVDFEVPKEWKGKDVLGVFDFGYAESLLFVNGLPYQGMDSNHQEVFLSLRGRTALDFRLWSGLGDGDHQIKRAFFCVLEPSVDELYYLLMNMVLTVRELNENDPLQSRLQYILVEGYRLLDFTNPGSPGFVESARKALEYYHKTLKTVKEQKDVSVSFIGHTHIDLSWLWRYKHTREKGERSFSTVLRLMERYDEYIFLQSQAQLYESIKEDHPDLFKAIAKRVAEGRWEASGAMWVEADCNIPSGESLVRQILYGKGFFKREFGVDNTFLWLPDVFGYNWALPQILKKSGIDTFITTKISWSEINRMPHDTFTWTGIDGSTVLTHFITTPDTWNAHYYTYNGAVRPDTVRGIWNAYQDKALNRSLLLSYGYGDGGGGVTRSMLENIRALSKLPGIPALKTERVDEYLKGLRKRISQDPRLLHNWDRELYLEYHRGTYTSQARTKQMNRKLELLYRNAEILQSLVTLKTGKWDDRAWAGLRSGWKLILLAQFHDIIPGSSIAEVYEDTGRDHQAALEQGDAVRRDALKALTVQPPAQDAEFFSVINTAAWRRGGPVRFPLPAKGKILVGENGALLTQTIKPGALLEGEQDAGAFVVAWVNPVSPLGSAVFTVQSPTEDVPAAKPGRKHHFTIRKNGLESPFYKIKWNAGGRLVSIYDREARREILAGTGNELQIFEDRPRAHDAWEIEAAIDLKRETVSDLVSLKVEEAGPLFARVRFIWKYNKSTITQDMILYTVHKRIDFKTHVNWRERSKLLKAAFPVNIRSVAARYDIQFGSLERNATRSTSWDEAQFEVVGHQWADYSETGFGVALLNDSKYGYDIKEGVMRLSLLKSAEYPDAGADLGVQRFTYSLYAHTAPWHESDLIPLAWDLNDPLTATPGRISIGDIVKVSGGSTALDAIKKSEDGKDLILRFHETHGGRSKLKLEFTVPVNSWVEANLMEEPVGKPQSGGLIKRELGPFEIVTFKVKLGK
ncbi:MAG: alpha-mannosidase [Treponema sp.]|jgi:alpha-mannosidase|nr:alpha-mannosidase [Treponema sp.]